LLTGAIRWVSCSAELASRTVLGATDEVVVVAAYSQDGTPQVLAFAAVNGDELWRTAVRPPYERGWAQGPIAGAGVVVLAIDGTDGPQLVGVDVLTGTTVWSVSGAMMPIANTETVAVVSDRPRGVTYDPQGTGGLRGLDRATGAELWSLPGTDLNDMSGVGTARGAAAVDGEFVVFPSPALVAIDAPSGDLLWQAPPLGHPSAAQGWVVGVSGGGLSSPSPKEVSSLDGTTGDKLWTQAGRPSYGELWAIGDAGVYVLDAMSNVVAYELDDGTIRWTSEAGLGEPQLVADHGVVLLWEASLAMLSTLDGSLRWALNTPLNSDWMNSAGANSTDVVVAVNSVPWGD
jgi:outer membrane protein assembly factor BamB